MPIRLHRQETGLALAHCQHDQECAGLRSRSSLRRRQRKQDQKSRAGDFLRHLAARTVDICAEGKATSAPCAACAQRARDRQCLARSGVRHPRKVPTGPGCSQWLQTQTARPVDLTYRPPKTVAQGPKEERTRCLRWRYGRTCPTAPCRATAASPRPRTARPGTSK